MGKKSTWKEAEGEDGSEDDYICKEEEEGELEVNSQDIHSPAVIKWLDGVNGEVIDISSGEHIPIIHLPCALHSTVKRSLTWNLDSDSDAESVIPHSNNKMSLASRSHYHSISVASLLRVLKGDKSVSLRTGEPFVSASADKKILGLTSTC